MTGQELVPLRSSRRDFSFYFPHTTQRSPFEMLAKPSSPKNMAFYLFIFTTCACFPVSTEPSTTRHTRPACHAALAAALHTPCHTTHGCHLLAAVSHQQQTYGQCCLFTYHVIKKKSASSLLSPNKIKSYCGGDILVALTTV